MKEILLLGTLMLKLNIHKFLLFLIIFINLCLGTYFLSKKDKFHVDEIMSYGLANGDNYSQALNNQTYDLRFLNLAVMVNEPIEVTSIHKYLATNQSHRFNYSSVYNNFKLDNHPPFFYLFVHTICSFFPNIYNKWLIGTSNLIFSIFLLLTFYKLALLTLKDEKLALLSVAFYAFSNACLGMEIFLRMYILQTLFATLLIYKICKLIKNNHR